VLILFSSIFLEKSLKHTMNKIICYYYRNIIL